MKMKQIKEAQAQENQEACVSAGRLTDGSQRRKPFQSRKIISLYHHRQKKEDAGKVGESLEAEGSLGAKDNREAKGNQRATDGCRAKDNRGTKESREAKGSQGTKDSRETRTGRRAEENPEMENSRELCVVCGRETEYARETPISQRRGYLEGAGQLCRRCFAEIYADGQL